MSEAAILPFEAPEAAAKSSTIFPLNVAGLCYSAGGHRLIDRLDLRLDGARRTVILGPNGAGKSLLLRLLQGLIAPESGKILWAGAEADDTIRRRIAIVFQRPVLLRRSVRANLGHALGVYGVPRAARAARIDELLRLADLYDLRDRPARVLSGGEQQRLSVIRALAAEPELLLLDEPTASLDPYSTHAIEELLDTARAGGTKILLVTHDLGQARRTADEIVFMHRGRVAERTPTDTFFDRPMSGAARAYVAGRLLVGRTTS